jgi:phosphoribosylanthranilate isomerase
MRTRIKFCGLVEPADLDCAVALGVDAVGFVFYERSARAVTQQQALSLRRRLPSFVSAVGLFVNAAPHDVRHISDAVGLDVIQFHGDEPLAACLQSVRPGQPWWRAVRMRGPADLLESVGSYQGCEAFLLDAFTDAYGGAGHAFEQLRCEVLRRAGGGRGIIQRAGFCPRQRNEFGDRLHRYARMHHHHIRRADDEADRRIVAHRIVGQLRAQKRRQP